MIGRFAPSPTGRMHLGNIYSALLAWLSARKQGGGFVLRIEDIDRQRSREEYALQIDDDLVWLGLDWDERYVQSARSHIYERYLSRLEALHLTYPCYCTRADIMATQAPHESDGRVVYKGTCRPGNIPEGTVHNRPGAVRVMVPDEDITFCDIHYGRHTVNLSRQCGDFILRRADGAWAYQLAVVVDDALMGITEVVRGRDLILSVPQQLYLFRLLGLQPPSYAHVPLLCNEACQRLSKRDKSLDMGELRARFKPEELVGLLAYYAGLMPRPEPVAARDVVSLFSWDALPLTDITVPSDLSDTIKSV
ncbi:MAG: tRNA glutamyl-Q(34) synthetase GluQRS [Prevotella sp.]